MKKYMRFAAIAAFASAVVSICGCSPSKPVLNVYMWSDYIDEGVVKEFEQQNNCKVVIDIFDSNEFMYSKLKGGAAGYDVVLPTSYMAQVMFQQNMIEALDKSKLPNTKFVSKRYLDKLAIDKEMKYSVPYMLGYTCVAYNKEKLGTIPNTWGVFSDAKLKGRMTMLNDLRETIGAALFYQGKSLNTTDPEALKKAKAQILEWKKNLSKFDNEVYKTGIQSGEFYVVQGYSGDLFQVFAESPNLSFMCPKEGVSVSCDDWVIPVTSKKKDLAYKFIDFMTKPENAARNTEYTCYAAAIEDLNKYLSPENKNHPGMNLPEDIWNRGEIIRDLGKDNALFNEVWDQIKLQH